MHIVFRKLRGLLGMGATWALAWGTIFAAVVAVIAQVDPPSVDPGEGPLDVAPIGALFGFISGSLFGLLLATTERRTLLQRLSLWRAAAWGALGTAAFPLVTPVDNTMLLFLCPIGAGLAAGTVALAKRADRQLGGPSGPASGGMLPVLWLGLLVAVPLQTAAAQQLAPGTRIRVTAPSIPLSRQIGSVLRSAPDSLVFGENGRQWSVARPLITRLDVSGGRRGHVVPGLIGGAVVGVGMGFILFAPNSSQCEGSGNYEEMCMALRAATTVAGIGLGALVGALIRTEKWVRAGPPDA